MHSIFQRCHSRYLHTSRVIYGPNFQKQLMSLKQTKVDKESALGFLQKCKELQDEVLTYDKLDSTGNLKEISKLTVNTLHSFKIDEAFLKKYWLTSPHFQDLIISIDAYYSQNRRSAISKDLAMIPFRRFLWDGQVSDAIKLIDYTVASPRYVHYKEDKRKQNLLKYVASCFGFVGGLEVMMRVFFSGIAGSMTPVYALILAYIGNMSFLASMAFSNRKSEEFLRFDNGTFQKYWYLHCDELQLMNRVVELDLKLNDKDNTGFASKSVVDELSKRKIVFNEPEQEIMLRQYWLGGGDGFVWVEPDQDPAELLWDQHLKNLQMAQLPKNTELN